MGKFRLGAAVVTGLALLAPMGIELSGIGARGCKVADTGTEEAA